MARKIGHGRPPRARTGKPAISVGGPFVAGVGPIERRLSSRTSAYELWAPLRLLKTDVGLSRLKNLHGSMLDSSAHRRFSAYLSQAETFFLSAQDMPPESRPLIAYYFVLNLTKAFLTCEDPSLTERKLFHGLRDAFERKTRYWFKHERMKIGSHGSHSKSAFHELATRTGAGFCHPPGKCLLVQELAPYLVETADLFEDAVDLRPRLVPLTSVDVWTGAPDVRALWLRAEVTRSELIRRGYSPASLRSRTHHFGSVFRLVDSDVSTASYESVASHPYKGKRMSLGYEGIREDFGQSLIHINRGSTGSRFLAIASDEQNLLSQEAVSFAVMHHLSNMVRYRPEQVSKLSSSKWFFLFTTWVPRAMENFYLALSSRILKEEVRID